MMDEGPEGVPPDPDEDAAAAIQGRLEAHVAKGRVDLQEREAAKRSAEARSQRTKQMVALASCIGALAMVVGMAIATSPRLGRDRSADFASVLETDALHLEKQLSWRATMPDSWPGLSDPGLAKDDCERLLKGMAPYPDGFSHLVMTDGDGKEVTRCVAEDAADQINEWAQTRGSE